MSGKELRDKLIKDGVVFVDLAKALSMSPQALNSKFNAKSVAVDFVESINKIVYNRGEPTAIEPLNDKADDPIKRLENQVFRLEVEIDMLRDQIKDMQEESIIQKHQFKEMKNMWVSLEKRKESLKVQGKRSS